MVHGHAGGLAAAELGEDHADGDVIDTGGVEGGVAIEGGAQDGGEEFFWVGVFEEAAVGAGDGGAQGGEDDDVGGGLGEDGADSAGEGGHGSGWGR